ncbi:phage integrase [Rhizobium etli CNPAF512]|nr:phage integrase [Rhizobium etli CNPAF512]
MRPQEYLAVPEHNLTDYGVNVEQAIERGDTKISVPKTRAGRRFIPLSPETISMVRHYAKNHGVPEKLNKHRLVFPTASGRWQTYTNWRRRGFLVACEEAGLGEYKTIDGTERFLARFAPYSLRHFYASMLIEQRTNLKRIQALMGHADIETTFNVYGHLIERKEADLEQRSGMIAGLRNKSCG